MRRPFLPQLRLPLLPAALLLPALLLSAAMAVSAEPESGWRLDHGPGSVALDARFVARQPPAVAAAGEPWSPPGFGGPWASSLYPPMFAGWPPGGWSAGGWYRSGWGWGGPGGWSGDGPDPRFGADPGYGHRFGAAP